MSMQSGTPSVSVSVSGMPQPHLPQTPPLPPLPPLPPTAPLPPLPLTAPLPPLPPLVEPALPPVALPASPPVPGSPPSPPVAVPPLPVPPVEPLVPPVPVPPVSVPPSPALPPLPFAPPVPPPSVPPLLPAVPPVAPSPPSPPVELPPLPCEPPVSKLSSYTLHETTTAMTSETPSADDSKEPSLLRRISLLSVSHSCARRLRGARILRLGLLLENECRSDAYMRITFLPTSRISPISPISLFIALGCAGEAPAPRAATPTSSVTTTAGSTPPRAVALRDEPPTRRSETVEKLHGVNVSDPYRWLEDGSAAEVKAWLAEQGAHARKALDALPERAELVRRFRELYYVERMGTRPSNAGGATSGRRRSRRARRKRSTTETARRAQRRCCSTRTRGRRTAASRSACGARATTAATSPTASRRTTRTRRRSRSSRSQPASASRTSRARSTHGPSSGTPAERASTTCASLPSVTASRWPIARGLRRSATTSSARTRKRIPSCASRRAIRPPSKA